MDTTALSGSSCLWCQTALLAAEEEQSRQKQSTEAGSELQTAEEMQDTTPPFPGSLASPLLAHPFARMRPTPSLVLLPPKRTELALLVEVTAPVHFWLKGAVTGIRQHLQKRGERERRPVRSTERERGLGRSKGWLYTALPCDLLQHSALACSSPQSPASLLFGLGNDIMAKGCHSPTPKEAEDGGGGHGGGNLRL